MANLTRLACSDRICGFGKPNLSLERLAGIDGAAAIAGDLLICCSRLQLEAAVGALNLTDIQQTRDRFCVCVSVDPGRRQFMVVWSQESVM